jgi:hypothetical protein
MLISRFNGVAWYHDVHTIAHHCEMQVLFPVRIVPKGRKRSTHQTRSGSSSPTGEGGTCRAVVPQIGTKAGPVAP